MNPWPKNVLMASPDYFDVTYAINPHMTDSSGALKKVDIPLAKQQWQTLRNLFVQLGLEVFEVAGQPKLPDMVFCANQLFPFKKGGKTQFVASRMTSAKREPEVAHFMEWAHLQNREVYKTPEFLRFEAMGDALWNYQTGEVFGGHGFRTQKETYEWLSWVIDAPIIPLQLISEKFYHMDTALSILDGSTALVVHDAFSEESLEKIKMKFSRVVYVDPLEAEKSLAANACCVDGKNVIVEISAVKTATQLRDLGYKVHRVDTSEFLKSGGSVFCLKLLF